MRIRVATANLYVHNPDPAAGILGLVRAVRPMRPPDSIGIQEASEHLADLRTLSDYEVVADTHGDRFARSNAILVNRRYDILDTDILKGAAGTGTSTTPPRNIVVARYVKQRVRIAHVNTHLHVVPEDTMALAALRGPVRLQPRAKQYVAHVARLLDLVEELRADGCVVFVTADGNTRPRSGIPDWEFSLYAKLAKDGRLKVERNGVDLIAYDERQVRKIERRVVPRRVIGSDDHDAIVVSTERIGA